MPPRKTTQSTTARGASRRTAKPAATRQPARSASSRSAETAPPERRRGAHTLVGALWVLVGIILLAYLAFGLYLYLAGPSDSFAQTVTSVFPYPASTVTVPGYVLYFILSAAVTILFVLALLWLISLVVSRTFRPVTRLVAAGVIVAVTVAGLFLVPPSTDAVIGYHRFLSLYKAEQKAQDKQKASQQGNPQAASQAATSPEQLRAQALRQLVLTSIIKQEAFKQHVKVSQKEVDETYRQYADRSQGEANLRKQIKDILGWSPAKFKAEIIKPQLLQTKLNKKLSSDPKLNADRKKKADDLLAQVKSGKDFAEVAKQSDDPTGQTGGDQGFVKKGEIDPALEGPAFSLEAGKVSDVIKTAQGYVILQVVEKQPDQVHLREILVKTKSLNDYIPDELKKSHVRVYVKDLLWDKTQMTIKTKNQSATPSQPGVTSASDSPAPADSSAPAASAAPDQSAPAASAPAEAAPPAAAPAAPAAPAQ